MSLIKKLNEVKKLNKKQRPVLFTTPSHSQGEFIPALVKKLLGKNFYNCDYSEIDGFDNLRNPIGIIKETQDSLAQVYGSKSTFMLTNGSSSGIISIMLATLKKDDKVLIARNCHVSVYNGLVLTNAEPIWIYPNYNKNWGIFEGITPNIVEKHLKTENIKAVILTSPTYEGVFSNIEEISKICKKYKSILIVDEAHGALTQFAKEYIPYSSAIRSGADASVNSLHKTAGAPNPCALLHIGENSNLSHDIVQQALNLINTTSPSYPLMGAIEATVNYLSSKNGQRKLKELFKNIDLFKTESCKNIEFYQNDDPTKIVLRFKNIPTGIATQKLNKNFNIEEEYSTDKFMLFLTGVGTTKTKFKKLQSVLNKISKIKTAQYENNDSTEIIEPIVLEKPSAAFLKEKKRIQKEKAIGKICGEIILNYPPGIPLILPGEKIQKEHLSHIENNYIDICK